MNTARADAPDRPEEELDVAAIARAGSNGFTLLLAVELGASALARSGAPGGLLLAVGAAAVYVVTGRRAASGRRHRSSHGALAAGSAYALTVPLRTMAGTGEPVWALLVALAFALAVGALGGASSGADRRPPGAERRRDGVDRRRLGDAVATGGRGEPRSRRGGRAAWPLTLRRRRGRGERGPGS